MGYAPHQSPCRIMVLGELPETEAITLLQKLDYEGYIELVVRTPDLSGSDDLAEIVQPAIRECRALISGRPSRTGRITNAALAGTPDPFFVASLSKGTEHIERGQSNVRVIAVTGTANAASVAELTILLTNLLLRPVHRAIDQMRRGSYSNLPFTSSRRLDSLTWTAVGAGAQVSYLVKRLSTWGLRQMIVYHPQMDISRLRQCASDLPFSPQGSLRPLEIEQPSISLAHRLDLIGTRDLEFALSVSDIVSLHVPLKPETHHLLGTDRLAQMKSGALLVNVSRGDVIDEAAVLGALHSGSLAGFASDVVCADAENTGDPSRSPLWQAFMEPDNELNIIVSPHVGGTTVDALEDVSREVIHKLLSALALNPNLYSSIAG